MRARRPILAALLLLAIGSGVAGAASPKLPLGRYTGQTSDGHVFQFTVVRNKNPAYPRRITHFYLVYAAAPSPASSATTAKGRGRPARCSSA